MIILNNLVNTGQWNKNTQILMKDNKQTYRNNFKRTMRFAGT